jgi:hypothetical protein
MLLSDSLQGSDNTSWPQCRRVPKIKSAENHSPRDPFAQSVALGGAIRGPLGLRNVGAGRRAMNIEASLGTSLVIRFSSLVGSRRSLLLLELRLLALHKHEV